MPNGKPGDHPYTDIVIHGSSAEFGEEVSNLVRRMAAKPGFAAVRDRVATVLEDCSYYGRAQEKDALIAESKRRLEAIDAELQG